jgi:hypothetical protein
MRMKRSVRRLVFGFVFGILMLTVSVLSLSTASHAEIGIGISVRVGPPALPVYAQPICPGPGYFWTPGYWAWSDDDGYYWVPGTWVVAPVGMLWTPGYWAFSSGFYGWHAGYWGRHVGFYGGINYGFGYGGVGFGGGEWRGGAFFYNRSVTNVNVTNVTNVYNRTVVVNNTRNVSYNGPGGIEARPRPQEERFSREPHSAALAAQTQHEHAASQNRQLFAAENHGRPAIAATAKPGEFNGPHVQRARAAGEPYRAPKISPQEARGQSPGNRGGNRGFETPARNSGNGNDRATSRPGNHEVKNQEARNPQPRSLEARSNQPRNREQMSSRDSAQPNRQAKAAQNQQRASQERVVNANRAPAKAEQRRNSREQRR